MENYPNKLLIDCFLKVGNKYLLVRRKKTEKWFPGSYGSLWREVEDKKNPKVVLTELFSELGIEVCESNVELKAIATNIFHDLKEIFNVFLFVVELETEITIKSVPEGDKIKWFDYEQMMSSDSKLLEEYKKVLPLIIEKEKNDILFYSTEYDFDKILSLSIFG
ncbi:NUDIX domain-containing protein [Candidatus Woesearchaeota archaeon]|jgi:ADP-ribose pyrophosphatase YjhB (NUDIX family)|nr:NUDIX domain-containing protein [Candidatus Woesearchaeota archaeon]